MEGISLGTKLGKNTMSSNQSLSCAITVQEHCSLMGAGMYNIKNLNLKLGVHNVI